MAILENVRNAAQKRLLFLPHAIRQMSRPRRMIGTREVESVVAQGEIIEDYANDPRGHSCLMLGFGELGRAVHVVCSPKDEFGSMVGRFSTEALEYGMYSLQRADEARNGAV